MSSLDLDKPLTEAELDTLYDLLNSKKEKDPEIMGLEELDGFFAALIAGPETVMPSDYLTEIFGEVDVFDSEEEADKAMDLIFRHWNAIAATLEKDEIYLPVFTEMEDDLPLGNDWARGFMRGVSLRDDAWKEVIEDEEHGAGILPMMILDNEHNPDPELRPPPLTPEKRKDLLAYMAAGLLRLYKHFKPQRMSGASAGFDDYDEFYDDIPIPIVRDGPKIGRNDPCPCGSGKKYKRCHGAVTVH